MYSLVKLVNMRGERSSLNLRIEDFQPVWWSNYKTDEDYMT